MKNTKLVGGILLIVGTAIGAGMLALPIASAELGFFKSTLLLLVSWLIMTAGALLILEVNLWLPADSNLISMAKATLGRGGEVVAWICYLLLLYALISAYIAGGGNFFHGLLQHFNLRLPEWLAALIFAGILSAIVYQGIRMVDYVNRGLMFLKLGVFIVLVAMVLFFIDPQKLIGGEFKYLATSFTVMLTSFGYATVIPSLRSYFGDEVKKLRLAIIIGSLIPLICYILWDLAIMGVIARDGQQGLIAMLHSGNSTSDLVNQLSNNLNLTTITALSRIFTSICLATSFLGVSLCLFDFFADGLRIHKMGMGNVILYLLTFAPPLAIVLLDPNIFIKALSYAGIVCMTLLVLLPALMAWRGRYVHKYVSVFQVKGGKLLLLTLIIIAGLVIIAGIAQNLKFAF